MKIEKINVLWIPVKMIVNTNSRNMVGVCLHTKRIFTIKKGYISPLIITDILLEESSQTPGQRSCEEAYRCLNVSCLFNKMKPKIYITRLPIESHWSPEQIKFMEDLCDKFPTGGVVSKKIGR